ncbi:MAG: acyl-CoA synthetase [Immundisolibacteraceae bacterium]|nr:acyl-CoA synthetase [Immundisolibacteraceae bacterium]
MFIPLAQLLSTGRPDNHPLAISAGEPRTFGQFRDDVAHNLGLLRVKVSDGSAESNQVLLFAEDSYWFGVGLLAILHAGYEVVLPENGQPGTLARHRQNCLLLLTDCVLEGGNNDMAISGGSTATDVEFEPLKADSCWVNLFTSGSSGAPKRIVKSLLVLDREAELLEGFWGGPLDNVLVLSMVSHQHLYGLTFKICWSLCAGRPFLAEFFGYWEPLVARLQELSPQPTCLISSPAHLTRYPPLSPLTQLQQPRRVFSAGAALSVAGVEATMNILGKVTTEVYGSTETGVVAWRQQTQGDLAWKFFDQIKGRVNDEAVLTVLSPLVDETGWLEIGDRVEILEDGRFLLHGRADRVVKVEGKRVSLTAIEQFLMGLELIEDASALVLTDSRRSLAAVVTLTRVGDAQRQTHGDFRFSRQLRNLMRGEFDQAELPRRWRFVKQIPVNPQGKRTQSLVEVLFDE